MIIIKNQYIYIITILISISINIAEFKIVNSQETCESNAQCESGYICEDRKCKGNKGAECSTVSRTLTESEWNDYRANPNSESINSRIDPSDSCAITLFCDNRKKCCPYGGCDWTNGSGSSTQPDEPNNNDSIVTPTDPARVGSNSAQTNNNNSVNTDSNGNRVFTNDGLPSNSNTNTESGFSSVFDTSIGSDVSGNDVKLPNTDLNSGRTSLLGEVEKIINWILGFLGILVFSLFLMSGFEYATAGGDEKKTEDALSRIRSAVIGMIILFITFTVTNLIVSFVLNI